MRGRPTIERPDVSALFKSGVPPKQISEQLNVALRTVYNYLRSRGLSGNQRGRPTKFDLQTIREMAAEGRDHYEVAAALGANWRAIYYLAKRHGICLAQRGRGRPAAPPSPPTLARAERMAEMYRNGCTLQAIGDEFAITRERVRQILQKHHALAGKDGGQAALTRMKRQAIARKKDSYYLRKHGCTWAQWKEIRDFGAEMRAQGAGTCRVPLRAYMCQKNNAKRRGIGWEISLWDWWQVWQQSGKWASRGRGQGYVMCRRGDEGPYAVGNVFIAPATDNCSRRRGKKSGLPTGVHLVRGRFIARRRINGVSYHIGTFATAEAASTAYLTFNPSQRSAA